MPIILSLEGNIGAGKSTLLEKLKSAHPDWVFVDEPVEQWMKMRDYDATGKSILELFYEDKARWAYTFQTLAVLTRAEEFRKSLDSAGEVPVIVMERCMDTDAEVFAKLLRKEGVLNSIEWELYTRWRREAEKSHALPAVDGYVWLDAGPEVCAQRIQQRARQGEDHIPFEYLKELDEAHREWLEPKALEGRVWRAPTDSNADIVVGVEEFVRMLEGLQK